MINILHRASGKFQALGAVALVSVVGLTVAGCSPVLRQSTGPAAEGAPGTVVVASPSTSPAQLTVTPGDGATDVNPLTPVTVSASQGTLTSVTLTAADGTQIPGVVDPATGTWSSQGALVYATGYFLRAVAAGVDGLPTTSVRSFKTISPANQTMAYINTASGYSIQNGATYGVGQALTIHWDEQITNRAAAQKAITVTTVPAQPAAFNWTDNQNMMWRTKDYMIPGTKVTVSANVFGVQMGAGLWGQKNVTTSFVVGDSHVAIADDSTKMITVYNNGVAVRTMPTSMGQGGYVQGSNGQTISLYTNSGPHIVIEKGRTVRMTSSSFGLPKTDPLGYDTVVNFAVKISNDGEYAHSAPWNNELGVRDLSHGCLNLSPADAQWFYDFSRPGDIVDVKGTPQQLAVWNSGAWTVPWNQWIAGSALPVS